jgi:hypothetical protein
VHYREQLCPEAEPEPDGDEGQASDPVSGGVHETSWMPRPAGEGKRSSGCLVGLSSKWRQE